MKEWAQKPTTVVQGSSSSVAAVPGGAVGRGTMSVVKTSGSIVNTSSSPVMLTSGSSTTVASSSSYTTGTGLAQSGAYGAAVAAPLAAGIMVGSIAAVFYGISNMIKYSANEKTGAQAARDTVVGSAGLGTSAGLGVAVAHAVAGTSLALGTTVVVPVAAGVGTVYAGIHIWDKLFGRRPDTSEAR